MKRSAASHTIWGAVDFFCQIAKGLFRDNSAIAQSKQRKPSSKKIELGYGQRGAAEGSGAVHLHDALAKPAPAVVPGENGVTGGA